MSRDADIQRRTLFTEASATERQSIRIFATGAMRSTCKISQTWPVQVPSTAKNSFFLSLNLFVSLRTALTEAHHILGHERPPPSPNISRNRCSFNLRTLLSARRASSCCSSTRMDLDLLRLRGRHHASPFRQRRRSVTKLTIQSNNIPVGTQ